MYRHLCLYYWEGLVSISRGHVVGAEVLPGQVASHMNEIQTPISANSGFATAAVSHIEFRDWGWWETTLFQLQFWLQWAVPVYFPNFNLYNVLLQNMWTTFPSLLLFVKTSVLKNRCLNLSLGLSMSKTMPNSSRLHELWTNSVVFKVLCFFPVI